MGGALLLCFNEFAGGFAGKHSDELPKARIRLRRIVSRHGVGWHEDHPNLACRLPVPFCHDIISAGERTIPLRAKTGPETDRWECEIAGI